MNVRLLLVAHLAATSAADATLISPVKVISML